MEGQGQCRVVQYRMEGNERKDRKDEGGRREDMETEEGRNTGDKEQS